jgi:uncharacterized repeat protein (TIGR02543 family)
VLASLQVSSSGVTLDPEFNPYVKEYSLRFSMPESAGVIDMSAYESPVMISASSNGDDSVFILNDGEQVASLEKSIDTPKTGGEVRFDVQSEDSGVATYIIKTDALGTFNVTFEAGGAGVTNLPSNMSILYGYSVNSEGGIGEPRRADDSEHRYSFNGWETSGGAWTPDLSVVANITVTASWNGLLPASKAISFNLNYDGAAEPDVRYADYNTTILSSGGSLPSAPTRENFLFSGWNTNNSGTGDIFTAETVVTVDCVVYAKWTAIPAGWDWKSDGSMQKIYAYTGEIQELTFPFTGSFIFEAWGADGGKYQSMSGGIGGYAKGILEVAETEGTLHVYVGGVGKTATTYNAVAGGWNGGGAGGKGVSTPANRYGGGSGGGATDVRFGTALNTRILVAGGAGGSGNVSGGGAGGGPVGGGGARLSPLTPIEGGTQTTGYQFGVGAAGGVANGGIHSDEGHGGGGGGYWGGKTNPAQSGNTQNAVADGGGGSGFVYGLAETPGDPANAVPAGNEKYRFRGGVCVRNGDDGFTANTAPSGNGQIRVTYYTAESLE